jgi:putative glycosyltransferase (TIGR04372 family)
MSNKTMRNRLLHAIKNKGFSDLSLAFAYAVFSFLGLLCSVPLILILWILKPFFWLKLGILNYSRIGHLALNTDLFLRRRQLGIYPDGPYYCFLSHPDNPANRQLLRMWKRLLPIYESRIFCYLFSGMLPILKRTPFYQDLPLNNNEYYELNNAKSSLYFTPDEIEKGRKLLNLMKVDLEKDEFVCIFSRDSAYLNKHIPYNNWNYQNARDSNIDSLIETTKYLIKKGYTVIRIGSLVTKPINFYHEKLIDYPYTEYQSEFLDIFLLAHCKFMLSGGTSGINCVASAFDRPVLTVNQSHIGYPSIAKNCLYIPKKFKWRKTGNYLHIEDAAKLGSFWIDPASAGLETEDASPQEILEASQEMLARLENRFKESTESKRLNQAYQKLWEGSGFCESNIKTPIALDWLKKNRALYLN